jgi:hypothetical protein
MLQSRMAQYIPLLEKNQDSFRCKMNINCRSTYTHPPIVVSTYARCGPNADNLPLHSKCALLIDWNSSPEFRTNLNHRNNFEKVYRRWEKRESWRGHRDPR